MLRQRADLARPTEVPDADGIPRPAPVTIGTQVPCALRPLTAAQAAQLRAESGAENIEAVLYTGPTSPELRSSDTAEVAGAGTWVAATTSASHYGQGGQLEHRSTPVVREVR